MSATDEPTPPRPTTRRRRLLRRAGIGLLAAVLVVVLAAAGAVLWVRQTSLPQHEGRVAVPGVSREVSVTRDQWGVPHIRAGRDEDAFFALGFVHWQDRSWQMEFQRRVVQGRLAEVLGPSALEQDRFLRTVGFGRAAESALPALQPRTRSLVSSYTAGVNAAMQQGARAPEFRILRFSPQQWTDVDSVGWSKLMAYDLGGNYQAEILNARAAATLGAGGPAAVNPPYPATGPTVLSPDEFPGTPPTGPRRGAAPDPRSPGERVPAQLQMADVPGKGSNNWVLAGSRTARGKPLLANDPHLALTSPMLWYLADVRSPGYSAIGATIPGLPGVVIGRGERIAWGVTNVNPDVQDLYIEPADAPLSTRTETIAVNGGEDVQVTVRTSRHGPLISDLDPPGQGARAVGERVALRWTALDGGDTTMDAFLGLGQARDWGEFTTALTRYIAPSQNFVYADVDGNIGYYAPGRVPVRRGWDGSLPVPGDGSREWGTPVPFEQLPHAYNPKDGLIVTANNRVPPRGSAVTLGGEGMWAEPYRAQRITDLLTSRSGGWNADEMAATQLDVASLTWRDLKPHLEGTHPRSPEAAAALERLRGWDGAMTTDSVAASIFEAWLAQLRTMAEDELGPSASIRPYAVREQLRTDGPLCADAPRGIRTCEELRTDTLSRAVTDMTNRFGADQGTWRWGDLHRLESRHRAFGTVRALAWAFNHGAPSPGGTNTVNVAVPEKGTFAQVNGASYRQIIDLADPDSSRFVGSLGQSGNPFADNVDDQQQAWLAGSYLPMSTRPEHWGTTRELTLTPGG